MRSLVTIKKCKLAPFNLAHPVESSFRLMLRKLLGLVVENSTQCCNFHGLSML